MKKLFSFVAVLFCFTTLLEAGELITAEWRTVQYPTFAEKVYDGTRTAIVESVEFAISNKVAGDDVAVEVESAEFDNEDAGTDRVITVTIKLVGADAAKYVLDANTLITSNQVIYPKHLTVDDSALSIETVRNETDFPLNPKAIVLVPSSLVKTEIIEGDVVELETTAYFANLQAALHKTVYVHYELTGKDNGNYYVDPRTEIYSQEGVITPAVDIDPFEDGAYFHFDGDAAKYGLCPDDATAATFQLNSGTVSHFSIRYSDDAKALGFVDVIDEALPAENTILVDVPAGAICGEYSAQVSLSYETPEATYRSAWFPLAFKVRVAAADVMAVYNDVVGLRDMDGRYTSFQWYRDGQAIDGATGWYYQQDGALQGTYKVLITTVEGKEYYSCEKTFGQSANVPAAHKVINAKGDIIITANGGVYNAQGGSINK